MEEFFVSIWEGIYGLFTWFFNSKIFFVIKVFLAIYTTVLIVDIILLVLLGDVRAQLRSLRKGASTAKTSKRTDLRDWKLIRDRLSSEDEKLYKAAILEADRFTYKALETQGYSGGNFSERLAQIPAGSFTSLEAVRDAHGLSVEVVQDEELSITKEQAENTLNVYEAFLKNLDVL
ncbi:MAG: hypothetical protein ABFQ53_01650 [Patescibacteria group bacterium]